MDIIHGMATQVPRARACAPSARNTARPPGRVADQPRKDVEARQLCRFKSGRPTEKRRPDPARQLDRGKPGPAGLARFSRHTVSARHRVLFVAHTEREDRLRIISARRATRQEQEQYEEGIDEATS